MTSTREGLETGSEVIVIIIGVNLCLIELCHLSGQNGVHFSEQGLRLDLRGQCLGLRDVMRLAASQADNKRIAERIDDGVDFRRQPAARAAYGFSAPPLSALPRYAGAP